MASMIGGAVAPDSSPETENRFRALVEVGMSLSSELTIDSLLQGVVAKAVALTGARYGALGVINEAGTELEQFITAGIEPDEMATIGDLPRGRGILGLVIREQRPLRLSNLGHDPRSVGFPPGHPPMGSFLGVPVMLRGATFGNLYLTEKAGADEFSADDEEIVVILAAQAAIAIENARLYESTKQWSRQLEALNAVSEVLTTDADVTQVFALAASRLRDLIGVRVVMIQVPTPDGLWMKVEAVDGENADGLIGMKLPRNMSKSGRALESKRSERIDSLIDDPEVNQQAPRMVAATAGLYVPLIVHDQAVGVIVAYDKLGANRRFSDLDMRLTQAFAHRAAVALDRSERVGRKAMQSLINGQEIERTRLARELHDETGQALAAILLGLKALEQEVGTEPLVTIRELVVSALGDVRRLTTELRPPALDDFGLESAIQNLVRAVADRSGLHVALSFGVTDRGLTPEHETAIYRIVQEALTNAIKHAQASNISIVVTFSGNHVRTMIEDDGVGFALDDVRAGALGLVGMRERVGLLSGRLEVISAPGDGTTLVLELPI